MSTIRHSWRWTALSFLVLRSASLRSEYARPSERANLWLRLRAKLASSSTHYDIRRASCVRDFTSSFVNTLRRWYSTVLGLTEAAWRTKPSWYLVATEDRMIPPPAQGAMSERAGSTVVEAAGSHAIYVSQPAAVVALIDQAASGAR
jgi:pimeloyl-ACP methyl ester carboxylesterase